MNRALIYIGVAAALAGTLGLAVNADPLGRETARVRAQEPVTAADALPDYEILNTVRAMGFNPTSRPERRGRFYIVAATNSNGDELSIVTDAQSGEVVSLDAARTMALAPAYNTGPRIIHVPDSDYRTDEPRVRPRRAAVPRQDDDVRISPPVPVKRVKPALPSPRERRAILSAPPHEESGSLTPVYPTPHWKPNGEKFTPPSTARSAESAPPPPPVGYLPPAAVPSLPATDAESGIDTSVQK